MADGHRDESGSPWGALLFLCIAIFILILFWFASGRPNAAALNTLFIRSPLATSGGMTTTGVPASNWLPFWNPAEQPQQAGQAGTQYQYQGTVGIVPNAPQLTGYLPSAAGGKVIIQDYSGARSSVPEQEYITVYASSANSEPIDITGWQLRSAVTGRGGVIGVGTEMPVLGQNGATAPIQLRPGDIAIITSGRSPIGTSFRENACVGYLGQYQYFAPPFAQGCPAPQNELTLAADPQNAQDSSCVNAVRALQPCKAVITAYPGVSNSCSDFMIRRFSYNGCVEAHQNDANFKGARWRIFFGGYSDMWNNQSDIVALLDEGGRLVTAVTY